LIPAGHACTQSPNPSTRLRRKRRRRRRRKRSVLHENKIIYADAGVYIYLSSGSAYYVMYI